MCRESERSSKQEKLGISSLTTKQRGRQLTKWNLDSSLSSALINPHICQKQLTANPARLVSLSVHQHHPTQCKYDRNSQWECISRAVVRQASIASSNLFVSSPFTVYKSMEWRFTKRYVPHPLPLLIEQQ